MAVLNRPGILGVFLRPSPDREVRVGTLVRDANGTVTFELDESYLRLGPARPILSLAWQGATEEETLRRLGDRRDKIANGRYLPPYFDNLLPEGALLELIEREFGTGSFDNYDVLARLGGDLPGAVVARREAGDPPPSRPAGEAVKQLTISKPISFSLAGVQMKFSMHADKRWLTAPGADESGDVILKLPSEEFPNLVENEFSSMQLAKLAGANVSETRLVDIETIEGVPDEFRIGKHALSVRRFDRAPGDVRIHTLDFAQIAGTITDQKYFWWNQDTILNTSKRFSEDPIGDLLEALRRLVVDIMIGNCDGHLKNWSFLLPDGRNVRLSPAYDIVSTLTYRPDTMALRLSGTKDPKIIDTARLRRLASLLKVDPKILEREMQRTTIRILDTWPAAMKDLPAPDKIKDAILSRFSTLALVREVRPTMTQGHAPLTGPGKTTESEAT